MWKVFKNCVSKRARGLVWLLLAAVFSGLAVLFAWLVLWVSPPDADNATLPHKLSFTVLRFLAPKSAETDQSCQDCEIKHVELHYMMPKFGNDTRMKFTFVQDNKYQKGKFQIGLSNLKYPPNCSRDERSLSQKDYKANSAELKVKIAHPDEKEAARADIEPRAGKQLSKDPPDMTPIVIEIGPPPAKPPYHVSVTCDVDADPHKLTYTKFDMDFQFEESARPKIDGVDSVPTKPQKVEKELREHASTEVRAPTPLSASSVNETQPLLDPNGTNRGSVPTSSAGENPEPTEAIQKILFKAEKDPYAEEPYFEGGTQGDDVWARNIQIGYKITMHWSNTMRTELKEIMILLVGIFGAAAIAAFVEAARPYIDRHGPSKVRHADLA